jgi:hypothetical protein
MAEDLAFALTLLGVSVLSALITFGLGYWLRVLTLRREQSAPAVQPPLPPHLQPVHEWIGWNKWYLEDEAWRLEAQSIHLLRQRTHPGEPLEVNLAEVATEMRRRHPELSRTLN